MKKIFIAIICVGILFVTTIKSDALSNYLVGFITDTYVNNSQPINDYAKNEGFMYVNVTDNFTPYSYQDLKNILFTIVNNGWNNYTFYCPSEYVNCVNDISKLSDDEIVLSHINNFVHPYNNFFKINTQFSNDGEITISTVPVYSKEQIEAIDTEVNRLMGMIVKEENTDYDNIKAVHDYIANNTRYDVKAKEDPSSYPSAIAYGTLFEHLATCNGYTDTMAIFLSKMGIKNYKISTTSEDTGNPNSVGHVWNAVYLEDKWYHLDLTWDDPVSEDGQDYLFHNYFLVSTEEMKKSDSGTVQISEHNFRPDIYLEFNDRT